MKIIIWLITIYMLVGFAMGAIILITTIKYEREIEREIGEKVERKNVKRLIWVSVFTWPIKVIQFIVIVSGKIRAIYKVEDIQLEETK